MSFPARQGVFPATAVALVLEGGIRANGLIVFASLSIVLDKPFAVSDFPIIGELVGSVEHIGLKRTPLHSLSCKTALSTQFTETRHATNMRGKPGSTAALTTRCPWQIILSHVILIG